MLNDVRVQIYIFGKCFFVVFSPAIWWYVKAKGDLQGIFHEIFQSSSDKLKQEVNGIYSTTAKFCSMKTVSFYRALSLIEIAIYKRIGENVFRFPKACFYQWYKLYLYWQFGFESFYKICFLTSCRKTFMLYKYTGNLRANHWRVSFFQFLAIL